MHQEMPVGEMLLFTAHDSAPNSHVALHPGWDAQVERRSTVQRMRSLSGHSRALGGSAHSRVQLPLRFVGAPQRDFLHTLWSARTPLALTLDTSHSPSTVLGVLANAGTPLHRVEPGYADRWQGDLLLEARDSRRPQGMPLLLDDAAFGRLDSANHALI